MTPYIHPSLKRKEPPKPRKRRLRSKRLAKRKPVHETYEDGKGTTYLEAVNRVRVFEYPIRRVAREDVLDEYRWMSAQCTLCRKYEKLEPHHLVGGFTKGRSHEHANVIALCRRCHEEVQSNPEHTLRVWKAKWEFDRPHCDWERLLRLDGQVRFEDLD